MNILIGGAWPYANGSLHIGHIAGLLPGDILARYYRLKGDIVCYVSGSDCHGTPILVKAQKDQKSPEEIALHYHKEFKACFEQLGFSYDYYGLTHDKEHEVFVQDFFKTLIQSGYVYKKNTEQAYCESCHQFLPDRFVVGKCPHCGKSARGDQCDACGALLDPVLLEERSCSICKDAPVFRPSEHFFLGLSQLSDFFKDYISTAVGWRDNAVQLAQRYLEEGLRDRAMTRDLDWGIPVPLPGYEHKKIYVWIEAVLGYLSASKKCSKSVGVDYDTLWSENALHYYVHGKDNVPFHTIILPGLLKAHGGLHLPDRIISSEYGTLEGRKISTSQNWAVWVVDLLERYQPDTIRYFFIANGPEKRDTDFSFREFINSHNGELLGAYGNFVNRSLVFIQKSFEGIVPDGIINEDIKQHLLNTFALVGNLIEEGHFKQALETVFSLVRLANKYFDEEKPWIKVNTDPQACQNILYTCAQLIGNFSVLLEPFLPFSSAMIEGFLSFKKHGWSYVEVPKGTSIGPLSLLFERIDKKAIDAENSRLRSL